MISKLKSQLPTYHIGSLSLPSFLSYTRTERQTIVLSSTITIRTITGEGTIKPSTTHGQEAFHLTSFPPSHAVSLCSHAPTCQAIIGCRLLLQSHAFTKMTGGASWSEYKRIAIVFTGPCTSQELYTANYGAFSSAS